MRIESGASQAEFAKRGNNLKQSTIAKFENGYSPNVTLRTVYEIAQASLLPLSELIHRAEGDKKSSPKEDSWTTVVRDVDTLPSEKRKWIARIVREMLRSDR